MERRGVLKSWDDGKGFGFIQPEAGGEQLFVHISAMRGDRRPRAGETVLFVAGRDREGRMQARHMRHAELSLDCPSIRESRQATGGVRNLPGKLLVFLAFCALPLGGALQLLRDGSFWVLGGYALFSLVSFLQYWLDKRRSATGRWRIPETSLHAVELLGGWPGALLAQQAFRHKTGKVAYQLVFWGIVLLHQVVWIDYLYFQRLFASAIAQRFLG
ncbi:DUF1294 domain-containing protein [Azotobacter chroococcum]|uniref:Uncharacterized membrane protein YsdA (DUF1294 family) n=1 Tax=Azotobacter chroococcum TaxID=353 RepID=A0A4R1PJG9_9GAMM|nr:DUF1294 domain-containing protein [Azotobacter chroococcum]TBV99412.1 DUF1294 domain-containing protein [Azotobacter chroococcum]TCL31180.1 uncharacterized membrane protein YsdA (DUF1294 family) [Azotobacter chroococcum]